jgi:hypothetical protein
VLTRPCSCATNLTGASCSRAQVTLIAAKTDVEKAILVGWIAWILATTANVPSFDAIDTPTGPVIATIGVFSAIAGLAATGTISMDVAGYILLTGLIPMSIFEIISPQAIFDGYGLPKPSPLVKSLFENFSFTKVRVRVQGPVGCLALAHKTGATYRGGRDRWEGSVVGGRTCAFQCGLTHTHAPALSHCAQLALGSCLLVSKLTGKAGLGLAALAGVNAVNCIKTLSRADDVGLAKPGLIVWTVLQSAVAAMAYLNEK